LGPFGIYEVLTAPHGRLSSSHITLDLPAHECNTHQTTQTHRWPLHQQPSRFSIIASPGKGHCSAVTGSQPQRAGEEPQRHGRLRIPASKSWKTQRTDTYCIGRHTRASLPTQIQPATLCLPAMLKEGPTGADSALISG